MITAPRADEWSNKIVAGLFVVTLAAGATIPHALNTLAALLVLAGLSLSRSSYRNAHRTLHWCALFYGLYVAIALLSLLKTENFGFAGWRLERYYPFLLAIPLLYRFFRYRSYFEKVFVVAVIASGTALGIASAYGSFFLGVRRLGEFAALNPNTFGHIAGTTGVVALGLLLSGWRRSGLWRLGLAAALAGAFFAVQASGSRGVLVALVPAVALICLVAWFFRKPHPDNKNWVLGIAAASVLGVGFMGYTSADRFSTIAERAAQFASGDYSAESESARLLLWWGAMEIFLDNPIIGTGIGDPLDDFKNLKQSGAVPNIKNTDYYIFHNAFADSLATTGLVGLVTMIGALFVYPASLAIRSLKKRNKPAAFALPLLGLVLFNLLAATTNSWPYLRGLPFALLVLTGAIALAAPRPPNAELSGQ